MKREQLKKRSRRGVTITEVVIALVLISIISAASLSVVMFAANVETENFGSIEAANSAENAIECYRFAETEEEFFDLLCRCGAYTREADGSIQLRGTGHTVTIRVGDGMDYVEYTAVDHDGDEIAAFRYPYGSTGGGA